MKRFYIWAAAFILLLPTLAYSNTLTLRLGYYLPRAQGGPDSLWNIEFDQMSFKKSNYNQSMLGIGYEFFISKELSLALSVDTYSKQKAGYYKDYVGYALDEGDFAFPGSLFRGDFDIAHGFNVSITPIQLSVKLAPLGRRTRVVPYVGGGISLFLWSVSIRGNIIDFSDEATWIYTDPDIGEVTIYEVAWADSRESSRLTVGYHAFAGVMFPVGNRVTLDAEVRYQAAKGTFSDAFQDFEKFDLGGVALSAGLSYWF